MNESIQRRIEQLLGQEGLSAQGFSRILFGPGGLFNQLATSEADRRRLSQSALFQRANERLTELQRIELADLSQAAANKVLAKANGAVAQHVETSDPRA